MKFTISSTALSSRLQSIGRVIPSKNTLPILDCFLFDIKGKTLTITASDNDTTVTTAMELNESDNDMRFAVNARTLQDAIKEIPEQPLSVTVDETSLEITIDYQNGVYNFMGQAADVYPVANDVTDETCKLALPADKLINCLSRAIFAAADDTYRPVMNGVFFDVKKNGVSIVASDGHKLALSTIKDIVSPKESSFILPKKPAILIKNTLTKETDDVVLRVNDRNAIFSSSSYTITCRLVEGRYPKYTTVIPQNNPNEATVNRLALLSALRRVLVFSNANSSLVKLQIEPSKIMVSSQDVDFSMSAQESLLCDYNGQPINIGFKGTYLLELVNSIESDEIIIKLADASRAGVIVPAEQPEGEEVLMLIMPMMLND